MKQTKAFGFSVMVFNAVVDCPMIEGGVEFAMTDTRVSLYNLRVE